MGNIGREVAKRAKAFGCRIVYSDTVALPAELEEELEAERLDLEELLPAADIATLHVPLTPETTRLIDRERLAMMNLISDLTARDLGGYHAVLAVQELAREAYQGGSRPRRATIASGKESGGLEYGVDVQITLARGRGSDRIAVAYLGIRMPKASAAPAQGAATPDPASREP
mgnify:CR=1 FL=1